MSLFDKYNKGNLRYHLENDVYSHMYKKKNTPEEFFQSYWNRPTEEDLPKPTKVPFNVRKGMLVNFYMSDLDIRNNDYYQKKYDCYNLQYSSSYKSSSVNSNKLYYEVIDMSGNILKSTYYIFHDIPEPLHGMIVKVEDGKSFNDIITILVKDELWRFTMHHRLVMYPMAK